jgi:polyribonucleotide nucleotidyltransferase
VLLLIGFDIMTEGNLQNSDAVQQGAMDNTVPISLKLLATHLGVGAIIGKHGSSITEIQSASGAKIQISGPNEVFPGTTERVMHLSGEMLKVRASCS